MTSRNLAKHVRTLGKLAAVALTLATPVATASAQTDAAPTDTSQPASADPVPTVFSELPEQEQSALEAGEVMVTAKRSGENGQFVARVLIDAPVTEAWKVLTDYDNFEQFLPNVEDSQLLESDDNRRVFEQLNVISIVPSVIDIRSRVVIESMENYPQQVDFNLVEGDLKVLQGIWKLDPVATTAGEEPDKVLITHQVDIDPGDGSPRGLFFSTYRLVLEDSLIAAKQETERRAEL
ncbi:MAG: SRPBCC family protein [Cyanobacteria bacterium J06614_10]